MPAPAWFSAAVAQLILDIRTIRGSVAAAPETSLYPALDGFLTRVLPTLAPGQAARQQPSTSVGAPDFVIVKTIEAIGYVECKAPNKNVDNLTGADKKQFDNYLKLDNWALTNFTTFVLRQDGVDKRRAVLGTAMLLNPKARTAAASQGVDDLYELLVDLTTYTGTTIGSAKPAAWALARATALVREAALAHLEQSRTARPPTPLQDLLAEYRKLLISDLSEDRFADSYAQTIAFGLLIARNVTRAPVASATAHAALGGVAHGLIAAALQLAAHPSITTSIGWSIDVLTRIVNRIDTTTALKRTRAADPLLYFYEDFLKEYNPRLRDLAGAFYTPPEVVAFQVNAIQDMLAGRMGRSSGLLDSEVTFLDPAAGTGTYLLTLMNHVATAAAGGGSGMVGPAVDDLLSRMFGFEYLIGPYTVSHLRLAAGALQHGASANPVVRVYLTDTLQEPGVPVRPTMLYLSQPLADEHNEADRVKKSQPIIVILGNPPYGRGKREQGSWVDGLMADFRVGIDPEDQKNLEDSYVRFLRWATWRLTETQSGPSILSFITNKSYLGGAAFKTLRSRLRRDFEQIYILNLNGDSKRALFPGDVNVFDVQVGVAIIVAVRTKQPEGPAEVWYDSWTGPADTKLTRLMTETIGSIKWQPVIRSDPADPFVPAGSATFADWPSLDDCFTEDFSGVETTRDGFVVAATPDLLRANLDAFFALPAGSDDRRAMFRESRDSKESGVKATRYSAASARKVAFRPYDVEYFYDDPDFVTWPRPELRGAWGSANVALATVTPLRSGPAVVAVAELPSRHVYLDGARLYPRDDNRGMSASLFGGSNLRHELLDLLGTSYGRTVTPAETFDYIAAVLSSPSYTAQYADNLEYERARVPFPEDLGLFGQGTVLGAKIIRNHTHGTPYPGGPALQIVGSGGAIGDPAWNAGVLHLNAVVSITGVTADEWGYRISRYPVIQRWLEARKGVVLTLSVLRSVLDLIWTLREARDLETQADVLVSAIVAGTTVVGSSVTRGRVRRALFGGRRPPKRIAKAKPKKGPPRP